MRLLLINYEMGEDSGVLAWQASVARGLAARCESVLVLTTKRGVFDPPSNMRIETLDWNPLGVARRFGGAWLMNGRVFSLCRSQRIQACFVHMAHEWLYHFYPALRLLRIPSLLWYAHGAVTPSLRLANCCATRVITSTPEGFRIPSTKVRVIGQGVDTNLFNVPDLVPDPSDIIYVGRISRRKRIELLLDVMEHVRQAAPLRRIRLRVIGPLLTADDLAYDAQLRIRMWDRGLQEIVDLVGFVPQRHLPALYRTAFLHLNVSQTGSMDKTVVEALACGCPVLTSNEAFRQMLAPWPDFLLNDERPQAIAEQVLRLHDARGCYDPQVLRALVMGHHDINSYVERVLTQLGEIA